MRVIIAGSRNIMPATRQDVFSWRMKCVERAVKESGFEVTVVISGGAEGIDYVGEAWAKRNGIPVERFPADWKKHGRAAGVIRNAEMAAVADALVAVMQNKSRGTMHMIGTMQKAGKPLFVLEYITDESTGHQREEVWSANCA